MIRKLAGILFLSLSLSLFVQAKAPHPEMLASTEWLAAHMDDSDLVILHFAKDKKEFLGGHIAGARWISADRLFTDRNGVESELPPVADLVKLFEDLGISNNSRIVIYTTDWPPMAPRVYFTLDYLGLGDRAAILDGGLEKWKAENRSVSTEEMSKVLRGNITAHPRPEIVATMKDVKAAMNAAADAVIVDSRPAKRYTAGHIPGAVLVYWQENVGPVDKNELLDAEDIAKNYDSVGAKPGKKLITYCEIGWQASHAYFTAKYLGYDVQMYDGSYQEWNDVQKQAVVKGNKPR
jgi:thiosulfate/3-mercaptopyruvate sulfurtransferase